MTLIVGKQSIHVQTCARLTKKTGYCVQDKQLIGHVE